MKSNEVVNGVRPLRLLVAGAREMWRGPVSIQQRGRNLPFRSTNMVVDLSQSKKDMSVQVNQEGYCDRTISSRKQQIQK